MATRQPKDEERPWNEEQWEAYMTRADLRADRFGELLETLADHPERDEIIAKEMGWDEPEEPTEQQQEFLRIMAEAEAEVQAKIDAGETLEDDDEDDVWEIPAYKLAMECFEQIHAAIQPLERERSAEDDERDEDLGDAFIGVAIAGAKLANGHGMGYEDDVLCGNIVQCRRALAGAEQSIRGLHGLVTRGSMAPAVAEPLLKACTELHALIDQRIAELRARVWW